MGSCEGSIPIFPDGFVADLADRFGDFFRRTFVGDVELARGPFARAGSEFHNAAAFGAMKILAAGAGVPARFGMAAGAHGGDAEWDEAVAQFGALAGGEDHADVRKHDA